MPYGFRYTLKNDDDVAALVGRATVFWRSQRFDVKTAGNGTDAPSAFAYESVGSGIYSYSNVVDRHNGTSATITGITPCLGQ